MNYFRTEKSVEFLHRQTAGFPVWHNRGEVVLLLLLSNRQRQRSGEVVSTFPVPLHAGDIDR